MESDAISAAVARIIRDVLDDPDFTVTPETSAKDHPEWDSFNHINMVVAAEMHFDIKFNAAEVDAVRNVGEFTELIARKREAA